MKIIQKSHDAAYKAHALPRKMHEVIRFWQHPGVLARQAAAVQSSIIYCNSSHKQKIDLGGRTGGAEKFKHLLRKHAICPCKAKTGQAANGAVNFGGPCLAPPLPASETRMPVIDKSSNHKAAQTAAPGVRP